MDLFSKKFVKGQNKSSMEEDLLKRKENQEKKLPYEKDALNKVQKKKKEYKRENDFSNEKDHLAIKDEEDIKYYSKLLGLDRKGNKGKRAKKEFLKDGIDDDLLNLLDNIDTVVKKKKIEDYKPYDAGKKKNSKQFLFMRW